MTGKKRRKNNIIRKKKDEEVQICDTQVAITCYINIIIIFQCYIRVRCYFCNVIFMLF